MSAPEIFVGLMSGTSLDGISAAAARFHPDGARYRVELLAYVQRPYDDDQRRNHDSQAIDHHTPPYHLAVLFRAVLRRRDLC